MNKTIKWVIGIVVVILVIWGVSASLKTQNTETIKIGVLTPLSGPIAVAGETQKNALSMAQKDNPNSKIELIYEDSKYDPKTSVSGYEALKLKGVKIIIADGSPVVASIREKAEKDGIMVFAQSATTPAFTDSSNLTCRIGLTADILAPQIVNYAKEQNINNIAILIPNNEYGITMKDEIIKSANSSNIEVVLAETYDQASGDLRSNALKLIEKKDQTDALVVINNITPTNMFNQLNELGYDKKIISDIWTITSPNMTDRTVANGVSFVDYEYSPQADLNTNEGAKEYSQRYKEQFNASPILLGALTYDSYNLLSEAINKVGGEPDKLAEYFVDMKEYRGITGNIDFDDSCQNINKKVVWREVLSDGSFKNINN